MYEDNRNSSPEPGFTKGIVVGAVGMLIVCLIITGVVMIGLLLRRFNGSASSIQGNDPSKVEENAVNAQIDRKTAEINDLIDEYYIFDVDSQNLVDQSISGYMSGLNDVYSVYYTKEEYDAQMEDSDGSFVGIGVSVQQDVDTLKITAMTVYPNSPAEKGGMMDGDIVVGVDGEDITGQSLTEVVSKIRGEIGTQVIVTVYRDGEYLDLTMIRDTVDKQTVSYHMIDAEYGYIALSEFDNVSVKQMEEALVDLESQGMKKLILDLRDNPGGLLTSVVAIADDFLPEGNIFYYEDKAGNQTKYDSSENQLWTGDMAVLINGNSASASEVLSGSLKDRDRAVLIGEQSFGKGIVQSFFELSDGSAIKLTTAHYFTPNGTDIHGVGIEPNQKVEDDPETKDVDEQLQAAIEALR